MRLFLLALSCALCSLAQATLKPLPENVVYANQIEPENFSYTVREPTVVRTAPGVASPQAGSIPFGARVTVLERPKFVEGKGGVVMPWYKIRGGKGDKRGTVGFVWGGDLAIAARDVAGGALVLVKLDFEKEAGGEMKPLGTAYVVTQKGREQRQFTPAGYIEKDSYDWQVTIEDLGVAQWKDSAATFFEVVANRESCDYGNNRALFIWNAKELVAGPVASFQGTEFGYINSKFIVPGQKDGKENKIVIETVSGTNSEGGDATPPQRKLAEWP